MPYEHPAILRLQHRNPVAVELAETVAFAAMVEPQLLRAARRELVPQADAGAEADVWLSSIVETRGPDGIVLDRKVAQLLRRQLRNRLPDRFDRAWRLVRTRHAHLPPAIQLEEEINYSLTELDEEARERVGKLLSRATATLVSDPNQPGIANWAARVLPSLPQGIRDSEAARVLAAAAYVRLANFIPEWSEGQTDLSGALPRIIPSDLVEHPVRVRFVTGGVELSILGAADELSIPVPATAPSLIEVSWDADGRREVVRVELSAGEPQLVETGANEVHVRTVTGRQFLLTQKPEVDQTVPQSNKRGKKMTCFVIMGFGKKTDYPTGRVIDLDKAYRYIIRPAAEEAGFDCMRADEIVHSGSIDVPMYEKLLTADVVIADLSTYNMNAAYELGVRHALRPFTTITIAEEKMIFPFDVNHIAMRRYQHLGEGIDYDEAQRMRSELSKAIAVVASNPTTDSPVYMFLKGLRPPALEGSEPPLAAAAAAPAATPDDGATGPIMNQAEAAIREGSFVHAKTLLQVVRARMPADPYVVQRLALATYKAKLPTELDALREGAELLEALHPKTSTDAETLGLYSAIHKRLWPLTNDPANLDEAIWASEKSFYLKGDYYNGINLAYLLDVRSTLAPAFAEAVADAVIAQRSRRKVLEVCNKALTSVSSSDDRYWILATMAEAYRGLGELDRAKEVFSRAKEIQPSPWMVESTEAQLGAIDKLLSRSPLRRLHEPVPVP